MGSHWALLYSGMTGQGSGKQSFLAHTPYHIVTGNHSDEARQALLQHPGQWFGYAGYELQHTSDEMEIAPEASFITAPGFIWFQPKTIQHWQHDQPVQQPPIKTATPPEIRWMKSSLSTEKYLQKVSATIERIHAGDFYQANITRKFYGELASTPDGFEMFKKLCRLSPSPFSAYLKLGDLEILSSSPEGFLEIQPERRVITRPIKGSAAPDEPSLAASLKNKAENLMIVDLMRNDLSRCCEAGSVKVRSLFDCHQFATIQQMISTIEGTGRPGTTPWDVLEACFPPGSMTGAPKRAAMQWIARQEQMQRGIYSGTLGWIDSLNHSANLSVIIRTIILQGNRFEFQVGGGIVADSEPQHELEETLLKARAICAALGVEVEALRIL